MRIITFSRQALSGALTLSAALALAACGGAEDEETEYEVGAEDLSGGEFTTRDPSEPAVPVDIPETEMTNADPAMADGMSDDMTDDVPADSEVAEEASEVEAHD